MKPTDFLRSVESERGSTLVLALVVLLSLSVLGATLLTLGTTEVATSTNWRDYSKAFYAADGGLESGVVGLRALLASSPSPTGAQLALITAPTLSVHGLAFTSYSVQKLNATPYAMQFGTGPYAGLSGNTTDYQITATAADSGGSQATLRQVFQYVQVPLFQFGVFYGQGVDLEIAPGPAMTFNGRVHANSNIYVGAGSTLQFNSLMTTAGDIYRHIKRDPANPWGNNPQIMDNAGHYQTLNFDHTYNQNFASTWSASQWQSTAQSTFGGQVRDSAMGVGQIVPPIPDLFQTPSNPDVVAHEMIELPQSADSPALRAAKLYSQAGLRIVDGSATDASGSSVSLPAGVLTTTSFYDAREQRTMTVTQVDVARLNSSGLAPANGILYVASSSNSPGHAVRLVNGSQLPTQGLTVVSQNAVYVQGNYNTVNKVPAAVLADAITVLSNNWAPNNSDSKGNQGTSSRPASATTVNAAFATAPSAESVLNQGNGQLENVIRFLEDWGGQTFTYTGSIVALWHSLQATGAWQSPGTGTGQYYTAPTRRWSYDTLFNTVPPPGTPSGVIMQKGRWSRS